MEVICSFLSLPFDFSSNTRYVHAEGRARSDKSPNNELRPLSTPSTFTRKAGQEVTNPQTMSCVPFQPPRARSDKSPNNELRPLSTPSTFTRKAGQEVTNPQTMSCVPFQPPFNPPVVPGHNVAMPTTNGTQVVLMHRPELPRRGKVEVDVVDWETLKKVRPTLSLSENGIDGDLLGINSCCNPVSLVTSAGLAEFEPDGASIRQTHGFSMNGYLTARVCGRFGVCSDLQRQLEVFGFEPFCNRVLDLPDCPRMKELLSFDLCIDGGCLFLTVAFRADQSAESFYMQFKIDPTTLNVNG